MRGIFALTAAAICALAVAQPDPQALLSRLKVKAEADRTEARALAFAYGLPMRIDLPRDVSLELAKFRNGKPIYLITDNLAAAATTRANRVQLGGGAGLSLDGSGIKIGEWDGGAARTTHQEFGGRVTVRDGAAMHWHSTHVAGTLIGIGIDPAAKGMAPAALLDAFDWTNDEIEMANEAVINGLRLSNHSYGYLAGWYWSGSAWYWYGDRVAGHAEDAGFGFYEDTAHNWDDIAYNSPYYLIFKSSGNDRGDGPTTQPVWHYEWNGTSWTSVNDVRPWDGGDTGYDTVSYYGVAKNIMTVGAVEDVPNYTGPASVIMTSFSGWGPADDGRIKPDIVANGDYLWSAYSSADNAYAGASGTSMSTPNACGSAALILQHCKNLTGGLIPRSDLLKGLIIHTADECGPNPGPDYMFGWGLMNTEAACAVVTDNVNAASPRHAARLRYGTLANGQTREWPFQRSTTGQVKVTICWTDPPGTPPAWSVDPADKMLVNDLDVRVIAPNGTTTYYPWRLSKSLPAAAATKGDNDVDNVEQVVIDTPVTGTYKIRVTHKGTLAAPQPFAMITDNVQPVLPTLTNLYLVPTAVYGGDDSYGNLQLDVPAFFGASVAISDNSVSVWAPAKVAIPEGTSTGSFKLTTAPVTADKNVTISATYAGVTKTAILNVWAKYGLLRVAMNKERVIGGSTPLAGTVYMNHPAPIEATPTLTSNSTNMTPPAFVLVNMLATSATFTIGTTATTTDHLATLTASYDGKTATDTVTIISPPTLTAINVPVAVKGGSSITGTVYFNKAAPSDGVRVTTWDNRVELTTPPFATIPSLQWFGNFTITTSPVTSPVTATVSASYRGVTRTDTVTINP